MVLTWKFMNMAKLMALGTWHFFLCPYFAGVSTFLEHTYFYPKKWFYFAYVTRAVFTH